MEKVKIFCTGVSQSVHYLFAFVLIFLKNSLKCQYAALNIDFWNYIFYWKRIFFVT